MVRESPHDPRSLLGYIRMYRIPRFTILGFFLVAGLWVPGMALGVLRAQDAVPNPFEGLSPLEARQPEPDGSTEDPTDAEAPDAPAAEQAHDDLAGDDAPLANNPNRAEPIDEVLTDHFSHAMLIDVHGPIFGRFNWYLNNRLDLAKRRGADLVILRLTSPGGDLEYSLQLARRLRDVGWAKTIVFIPQEAISGGAIISLGADRIYMQSGALIGDAGPIRMGAGGQFQHAEEKVVSYLAQAIRELAEAKNRPGALAEAMVDRKLTVFEALDKTTGERVFLTEREKQAPGNQQRFQIGLAVPATGQNRFLTVDGDQALELRLCEAVFASEQDLLQSLSIDEVSSTELTWVDSTVFLLNRPWLTAILLIVGLIGLYIELAAPGISVAGLASMSCFGIFFWSHALGGTSGWLEFLLFMLGVTCVICEMFVLPGFGVFGVSGILLLVLSLVMASQDFVLPDTPDQWSQLRGNVLLVLGSMLGVMLLFFGQLLLLDSLPGLNRFRLATPGDAEATDSTPITGLLESTSPTSTTVTVGLRGTAESDLRPSGKVIIENRLVDVVTEGDYITAGTAIEVVKIEGNRVVVRKGISP